MLGGHSFRGRTSHRWKKKNRKLMWKNNTQQVEEK